MLRKLSLGFAPMLLAIGGPAHAQSAGWRVSEVSGEVRIVENGRARAATRGALLSSGSTIATAAQGRAVLVRGSEFVVVSPGSQLRIPQPQQGQPQGRRGLIQWLSDWGTALFRIERQETPHFGVQTPYLAAVVKGTTFTVTVGPAGASVQVTEGAVEVSTPDGGAVELIRPGMIASVSASDLHQLNVEGDVSRSIRSPDAPTAGSANAPSPYAGPEETAPSVEAPIAEDPVSLVDVTGGLVEGGADFDLAMADVSDQNREGRDPAAAGGGRGSASDGPPANSGNGGSGSGSGSGNGNGAGNGNPPTDPGNGNPPTDPGNGNPPTDPGNGNPPTDPGNGNPGGGPPR